MTRRFTTFADANDFIAKNGIPDKIVIKDRFDTVLIYYNDNVIDVYLRGIEDYHFYTSHDSSNCEGIDLSAKTYTSQDFYGFTKEFDWSLMKTIIEQYIDGSLTGRYNLDKDGASDMDGESHDDNAQ